MILNNSRSYYEHKIKNKNKLFDDNNTLYYYNSIWYDNNKCYLK